VEGRVNSNSIRPPPSARVTRDKLFQRGTFFLAGQWMSLDANPLLQLPPFNTVPHRAALALETVSSEGLNQVAQAHILDVGLL
jgi:hypothetical protein